MTVTRQTQGGQVAVEYLLGLVVMVLASIVLLLGPGTWRAVKAMHAHVTQRLAVAGISGGEE